MPAGILFFSNGINTQFESTFPRVKLSCFIKEEKNKWLKYDFSLAIVCFVSCCFFRSNERKKSIHRIIRSCFSSEMYGFVFAVFFVGLVPSEQTSKRFDRKFRRFSSSLRLYDIQSLWHIWLLSR